MPRTKPSYELNSNDTEPPEREFRVLVSNQTNAQVDVERIEAAVRGALGDCGALSVEVSVAIVDDAAIHALNRQFLGHDYPTDVLSFVLEDERDRLEGEIVVSLDTARRGGREAGWSADDELLLYVVHGALHLAGYRDKTPADAVVMRATEVEVLDALGVARSATDSRWRSDDSADDEPEAPGP